MEALIASFDRNRQLSLCDETPQLHRQCILHMHVAAFIGGIKCTAVAVAGHGLGWNPQLSRTERKESLSQPPAFCSNRLIDLSHESRVDDVEIILHRNLCSEIVFSPKILRLGRSA